MYICTVPWPKVPSVPSEVHAGLRDALRDDAQGHSGISTNLEVCDTGVILRF